MATLNVATDYGAVADGTTDDSGAIQQAIDAAGDGDTVYIPGDHNTGTYLVMPDGDPGAAIRLVASQMADNITIEGDLGSSPGESGNTRIMMGDVDDSVFHHIFRPDPDGILNFTLREMEIDGQNDINTSSSTARPAYCINEEPPGVATGHSHVYEDLYLVDAAGNGTSLEVEATIRDCTAVNCDVQGIGMQTAGGGTTTVRRVKIRDCGNYNAGSGIDFGTGNYDAQYVYSENNLYGNKFNARTGDLTLKNATFVGGPNQQAAGFRWNDEPNVQTDSSVVLDAIACRDGGDPPGMRIDGAGADVWDIGTIETTNCDDNAAQGGVWVRGDMTVTADAIYTKDNGQYGIDCSPNNGTLDVTDLYCDNNGGGCIGGTNTGNLTVGTQHNERKTLDTPTANEVGVFGSSATSPATLGESVRTVSGVMQTEAGIYDTFDQSITSTIIDNFEAYGAGDTISATANEWGETGSFATLTVLNSFPNSDNTNFTSEGNNAVGRDSSFDVGYSATQSTTNAASTTNQSATFDSYPSANCTIRCGVFVDNGYADVAFGVPSDEANFNNNCYRIRGGDLNQQPFIRRTVNGANASLSSFNKLLSSETWYDYAIEFEATGTQVNISLQVWEWDSGSGNWVDWGTISGSDTNNAFPNESGVAVATNLDGNGTCMVDNYRYFDSLGETSEPQWTP